MSSLLTASLAAHVFGSETTSLNGARRWNGKVVRLSIASNSFQQTSAVKFGTAVGEAVDAAAATWSRTAVIDFRTADTDIESVSDGRTRGDGVNLITIAATPENIALFPKQAISPPAYTRLFFDRRGTITEADVVLNPFLQFSSDGSSGTYDLQAVLTHELGHVIGLVHSPVRTSSMYERISPNLDGSSIGFAHRSLAESDVAAARGIYGARGDVDCCVSVFGSIAIKASENAVVWVEEASTGRILASRAATGGRFDLSGLAAGVHRVYSQPVDPAAGSAAKIAEKEFDLVEDLGKSPLGPALGIDVRLIGLNAELGGLPVTLFRGRSYQLFVGGIGLGTKSVNFGFSTSSIAVIGGTTFSISYGKGVSAVAMNVIVEPETPPGEYSIFVESGGVRRYLLGAVSVE